MYEKPLFLPAGDQAMIVELGDSVSPQTNSRVQNLTSAIEKAELPGVYDLMPTYRSLLIYYDPLMISAQELQAAVERIEANLGDQPLENPRVVHIPTLYGGEYGPDLEFVAKHTELTKEEVVATHSGTDYLVYMIGFSPGFPYLGGLPQRLKTPRLETPRTVIPAGSVGIAEGQTGVYSVDSPGGWRLIGRTPLKLFYPTAEFPALLRAGDHVRFVPIAAEDEYLEIGRLTEGGRYQVTIETAP